MTYKSYIEKTGNIFGSSSSVQKTFVAITSLILLYAHIFSPYESWIALSVIVGSIILGEEISISMYLCTSIIQIQFNDFQSRLLILIMALILLSSILRHNIIKKTSPYAAIFILFWLYSVISTVVGYKANLFSTVLLLYQLLIMIVIIYYIRINRNIIIFSLVASGLCVCLYVFYQYITGNASYFTISLVYGNGEEAGQVKDLSTCVAIPAYFCFYSFLYDKVGMVKKILFALLFLVCIVVIVLTYSRGVLLSIGFSSILLILYYYKKKITLGRIFVLAVSVIVLSSLLRNIDFEEDKMLSNLEGGNGRVDIWLFYISKLWQGGISRILLGLGAGDSIRITAGSMYSDLYAHSVILDYLFSFGIIGFIFMAYLIFNTINVLFNKHLVFYMGLLVLVVTMFFTHGSYLNMLYHTVLAICIGSSYYNFVNVSESRKKL